MQRSTSLLMKVYLTSTVTVLIFGLLFWQYFHGGVPAHHILQQKELPEISNWWGGLLLSVLTWFLLGRIERRFKQDDLLIHPTKNPTLKVVPLFLFGLLFGVLISVSFTYDYKPLLDNVLYIILVFSFFFPIYYSEFILGFILGMTYTFGATLPTIFMLVLAGLGFLVYKFLRPLVLRVTKAF